MQQLELDEIAWLLFTSQESINAHAMQCSSTLLQFNAAILRL